MKRLLSDLAHFDITVITVLSGFKNVSNHDFFEGNNLYFCTFTG